MNKYLKFIFITIILCCLFTAPVWLGSYWIQMLIYILWTIFLASAWHLVLHGGLFSLMHGLFLGAGAYTTTVLWLSLGLSPWLGLLAGVLVAVILALFTGWLILRNQLPLLAFAAITLALSFIGMFTVNSISFLGGGNGLANHFIADNPWNFQWVNDEPYYYIILLMAIAVVIVSHFILSSRLGLFLRAGAENPRAAAASGVRIFRTRLVILVISASLTALGGGFWTQYANYIDPVRLIGPQIVVTIAILVLIGGTGTVWGAVVGPALLIPVSWILGARLGGKFAGIDMVIYGFGIVILFRFLGTGIVPWLEKRFRRGSAPAEQGLLFSESHLNKNK